MANGFELSGYQTQAEAALKKYFGQNGRTAIDLVALKQANERKSKTFNEVAYIRSQLESQGIDRQAVEDVYSALIEQVQSADDNEQLSEILNNAVEDQEVLEAVEDIRKNDNFDAQVNSLDDASFDRFEATNEGLDQVINYFVTEKDQVQNQAELITQDEIPDLLKAIQTLDGDADKLNLMGENEQEVFRTQNTPGSSSSTALGSGLGQRKAFIENSVFNQFFRQGIDTNSDAGIDTTGVGYVTNDYFSSNSSKQDFLTLNRELNSTDAFTRTNDTNGDGIIQSTEVTITGLDTDSLGRVDDSADYSEILNGFYSELAAFKAGGYRGIHSAIEYAEIFLKYIPKLPYPAGPTLLVGEFVNNLYGTLLIADPFSTIYSSWWLPGESPAVVLEFLEITIQTFLANWVTQQVATRDPNGAILVAQYGDGTDSLLNATENPFPMEALNDTDFWPNNDLFNGLRDAIRDQADENPTWTEVKKIAIDHFNRTGQTEMVQALKADFPEFKVEHFRQMLKTSMTSMISNIKAGQEAAKSVVDNLMKNMPKHPGANGGN
jgi:hypothetical protein